MEREIRASGALPETPGERYEPPAIEWEEPFDAVAMSDCCIPAQDPLCNNPC